MSYLLAINCGSSSIKGKLYHLPSSKSEDLSPAAGLSISNISSKGEKIKIKIQWERKEEGSRNVDEEGDDGGEVDCMLIHISVMWSVLIPDQSLVPLLLEKLTSAGKVDKDEVKYVTHRV
jgi:acetate kinase